jgi:hypothetical protein
MPSWVVKETVSSPGSTSAVSSYGLLRGACAIRTAS